MVILWAFAVAGAGMLLWAGWSRLLVPQDAYCLHLLFTQGDCPNLEQLLRWSYGCLCWDIWMGRGRLVVVTKPTDEKGLAILECFVKDKRNITVCGYDELEGVLVGQRYNQVRVTSERAIRSCIPLQM